MACPKTWKSYSEQLDLLKSRGMNISDKGKALEYLERIGYYRLSGYWYPFREHVQTTRPTPPQRLDTFKQGTYFSQIVELYVFDKQLRLLLIDALERIEIALRADIVFLLGKYDPFVYLHPQFFSNTISTPSELETHTKWLKWLTIHTRSIDASGEECIKHYKSVYGLPLPIWVACEVWDFGTLSVLFSIMRKDDQEEISKKYDVLDGKTFASWLYSLNYLRNVCAHHNRLWNRNIHVQPKLPHRGQVLLTDTFIGDAHKQARVYLLICICRHFMGKINPSSTWWERLKRHLLDNFPQIDHLGISVSDMGTIIDWDK